jgi:hypothetical protein
MTGPRLEVIPDSEWMAHLKAANVSAWYCNPKNGMAALAPGAYSSPDNIEGPDDGDRIVARRTEWDQAARAARAMKLKQAPAPADMVGFRVIEHEFSHCFLPAPYEGLKTFAPATDHRPAVVLAYHNAQQRYSHPDKALSAVLHAIGCGFQTNSFTRLLRWRTSPPEVLDAFLAWMDYRQADVEAGV